MAIIAEELEETQQPISTSTPTSNTVSVSSAFTFWAYFTLLVSLITLLFIFINYLTPIDDKSWFLSLPTDVRLHYSKGRTIKVQTTYDGSPFQVFAIKNGPRASERPETVFLIHGFGCTSYSFRNVVRSLGLNGFRAVAIDLPGSGFSDRLPVGNGERRGGVLGRMWDVYSDIKEKGIFWGFDQLVETGSIPYEEHIEKSRVFTAIGVSEEIGRVIGQVIDSMGLSPVHLVLHDSALLMAANWVSENSGSVSSLTLVDTSPRFTALPLGVLETPIVRELVLGVSYVYAKVLRLCCSRSMKMSVVESHRALLSGRKGMRAIVEVAKGLNYSFDMGEWRGSDSIKDLPVQVIWSSNWSDKWSDEGRRIADSLSGASLVMHSGGRWPQEDASDEVAEAITHFISSLPKSVKQVKKEPLPEHIQKMFDEAKKGDHHHGHEHHGDHTPGYMDAYGLGQGWGS
ncbi:hypothetical protein GIB67_029050 [Kingdonia uniflora]|uniref:AB hydrolase-1 domain-containing protein n=1 Tax=Kingdonia uniflora TaxID=39325 RepID=A0A7J7N6F2_9MAGN|nr:hypothetical protein GIB67_029050 [Kingdonia uniflora]